MAEENKKEAKSSAVLTEERSKFKEGQLVKYQGKPAKVASWGRVQTSDVGEDLAFSAGPVLGLQLPPLVPGGRPEYAYNVDPKDVSEVDDKGRAAAEKEWAEAVGGPLPPEPSTEKAKAPVIRQSGPGPEAKRTSSTRGKAAGKAPAGGFPPPMGARPGETVNTAKRTKTELKSKPKAAPKKKGH